MPRILAAILLVAVLAIGGGLIATTAYQAGLGTAVTTATGSAGTVVAPVVVPRLRLRLGPAGIPAASASGSSASSRTLFFLFIVFALIRAIFWRGGPGRRGWGRAAGAARLRQGPRRQRPRPVGEPRQRDIRRLAPPRPRRRPAPPEPSDPTKPTGTA